MITLGPVDSEGWLSGEGVFETIRLEGVVPLLLDEHLERISGSITRLKYPCEISDFKTLVSDLAAESLWEFGRFRLMVSNTGELGISITEYKPSQTSIAITSAEMETAISQGGEKKFPYFGRLQKVKTLEERGFDEAILIDGRGFLTEGYTCNYAFLIENDWVTPKAGRGVLPGVVRGFALQSGYLRESEISHLDITKIQSAIALSSLRIASVVRTIGSRQLPNLWASQALCSRISAVLLGG
jgi:branched-chain amino acid aminotransferase